MKFAYLFITLIFFLLNTVAAIPVLPGYLANVVVTPSTVKPGDQITVTWDVVKKHKNIVFDLYLGHSTGMNQAPQTLLKPHVKATDKKAVGTIPSNTTKSGPGNIWIIETIYKKNGYEYTLNSNVITVE
ncbi:unnamed protein product [Cunninghamella blakesleeana]